MKSVRKRAAFTLVEVLLVVVIMAILAATVVPQFTASSDDATQAALTFNLHTMRSQIELYKMDHAGTPPAITNDLEALTSRTDADGTINASGAFGPYLVSVPQNPLSGVNTVTAATFPFTAESGTDGWLYDETVGRIAPDATAHLND